MRYSSARLAAVARRRGPDHLSAVASVFDGTGAAVAGANGARGVSIENPRNRGTAVTPFALNLGHGARSPAVAGRVTDARGADSRRPSPPLAPRLVAAIRISSAFEECAQEANMHKQSVPVSSAASFALQDNTQVDENSSGADGDCRAAEKDASGVASMAVATVEVKGPAAGLKTPAVADPSVVKAGPSLIVALAQAPASTPSTATIFIVPCHSISP